MYEIKKSNLGLLAILFTIVVSYIFGFYLNEDSAGGGKVDYIAHEWGTIQLFINNDLSVALNSVLYESSRTPLFYIINKFIPFSNDIKNLKLFWFIFSSTIPFLLYYTLKLIVSKKYKLLNSGQLEFAPKIFVDVCVIIQQKFLPHYDVCLFLS